MDMISLYNTKRRLGREWGRGEKRGIPWAGQIVVIASVMPGFEKVVLGTTNGCTVLLAEKSQLSTRQAVREKLSSKGHCFLRGRVRRGGEKRSQWRQMSPWKSHIPFTLIPSYMAIHSLPTSEIPRYYSWMLNEDFSVTGNVPSTPTKHQFHKPRGLLLIRGLYEASELAGNNDLAQETSRAEISSSWGWHPLKLLRISHLEDDTVTTIEVRGFLGHISQTRMDQLWARV